jgi:hypothetical protein
MGLPHPTPKLSVKMGKQGIALWNGVPYGMGNLAGRAGAFSIQV